MHIENFASHDNNAIHLISYSLAVMIVDAWDTIVLLVNLYTSIYSDVVVFIAVMVSFSYSV